jgi:hypothetical protein
MGNAESATSRTDLSKFAQVPDMCGILSVYVVLGFAFELGGKSILDIASHCHSDLKQRQTDAFWWNIVAKAEVLYIDGPIAIVLDR